MRLAFVRTKTESTVFTRENQAAPAVDGAALEQMKISAKAGSSSKNIIMGLQQRQFLAVAEEWKFWNQAFYEVTVPGQLPVLLFPCQEDLTSEELTRYIRRTGQPDIIWVEGPDFPPYLAQIFDHCPDSFKLVYSKDWRPEKIKALPRYDLCLVDEAWEVEEVKRVCPQIHCAIWDKLIDYETTHFPVPGEKMYDICYVAYLRERKNHEMLLRAMAKLPERQLRCVCIGDDRKGNRAELEKLARELNLAVHFTGEVPKAEVNRYVNQAKIGVMCATLDAAPRAILEYMAANVPVLVNAELWAGGRYVGPAAGLIKTPAEFHLGLAELLDTSQNYSPRAYLLQHYSAERVLAKFTAILRQASPKFAAALKNTGTARLLHKRKKRSGQDEHLPHLARALDAVWMKPALQEFFQREYPGHELLIDTVAVGKVYHKPGKSCEITYTVRCRDREQRQKNYAMWFVAKMPCKRGKDWQAAPDKWPGCGFWKPANVWPEMDMVLYTFPYDRKLPYLGQLLEPAWIKQQIAANRAGLGLPDGATCQQVAVDKVKYMPGKRCVLRYTMELSASTTTAPAPVFYSKTYDDVQGWHVYRALQKICASPACHDGRLNVPAPIAYLDAAHTVWQQAWEGEDFNIMMQRTGWTNLPRTAFPQQIATMLAALHQIVIDGVQLRRGPSRQAVFLNACNDASDIAPFLPRRREELDRVVKTLESTATGMDAEIPQTTIHGSFKLAQLLCRDGELALIDFDSIACGDPLYDVAELAASLAFLKVSDAVPAAPVDESIELYLTSYQQQVPWACDRRRLAWYVTAFLLGKIHAALKRRETVSIKNMALAFSIVQNWLENMRQ